MIPFVKKMPAIEYFKALVLMFKPVKNPPTVKSHKLRYILYLVVTGKRLAKINGKLSEGFPR